MTGGEIAAVGKVGQAVSKKLLAEDEQTRDVLLRLAEGTPEMAAAARSMAARAAVKERVKLKLYEPFARMIGVSKAYFEDTFPLEMATKVANIPEENLETPAASVAVPALQGLSYTFGETSLKEMYLNLLATASDSRRAKQAHPAFAEVIKQLAPDEAELLKDVLAMRNIESARLTSKDESVTWIWLSHLLKLENKDGSPRVEPQIPIWVENWSRLGLFAVNYLLISSSEGDGWVAQRPEFLEVSGEVDGEISFTTGIVRITDFGEQFFMAIS